jgi:hypothetical protein
VVWRVRGASTADAGVEVTVARLDAAIALLPPVVAREAA